MALVREERWLIDPSSGFVLTAAPRVAEPQQKEGKEEKEDDEAVGSLVDLALSRILDRLEGRLTCPLGTARRAIVLSRARWREFSDAAVAVAGYVAHWGKKTAGEVAQVLRDMAHRDDELAALRSASDLSTRVSRAAERAALCHPDPHASKPEPVPPAPGVMAPAVPPRMQQVRPATPVPPSARRPPTPLDAPAPPKYAFDVSRDEMNRRARKHELWHRRTADLDEPILLELVRNLCIVAPTLLLQRDRRPPLGHVLPVGEAHPEKLVRWTQAYLAPLADVPHDSPAADQFRTSLRAHAAALRAVHAVAAGAARAQDKEDLRFCAVNAVHLHRAEEANDAYTTQFLDAVFALSEPKASL
jgi:hypothetical protein